MGCFIISVLFAALFPQHVFPGHLYRVTHKWRMNEITYMIQVMKQWWILISIDMWQYHKSTFLCTHQRLKISLWKIKMSSVLSLVVNSEIYKDPNKATWDFFFFFSILSQETAATWYSLGFIWTPLDRWSVKPHTTWLNFLSILTKQCTILNSPEKWLHNRIYYPSNRSKQIQATHTGHSASSQYTRQSLNEKQHTWLHIG